MPGRHAHRLPRGGEIPRQDRNAVERTARRHHASRAQEAARRLDADEVIERRRDPAGSCGIGPEREANLPECDRDRRAAARSPAHVVRVERVGDRSLRGARADEPRRELIEMGLADADRTSLLEPLDDRRRVARCIGERRASGGRRKAGDVDVVLDRERNAVQRKRSARLGVQALQPLGAGHQIPLIAQGEPHRPVRRGARRLARTVYRRAHIETRSNRRGCHYRTRLQSGIPVGTLATAVPAGRYSRSGRTTSCFLRWARHRVALTRSPAGESSARGRRKQASRRSISVRQCVGEPAREPSLDAENPWRAGRRWGRAAGNDTEWSAKCLITKQRSLKRAGWITLHRSMKNCLRRA